MSAKNILGVFKGLCCWWKSCQYFKYKRFTLLETSQKSFSNPKNMWHRNTIYMIIRPTYKKTCTKETRKETSRFRDRVRATYSLVRGCKNKNTKTSSIYSFVEKVEKVITKYWCSFKHVLIFRKVMKTVKRKNIKKLNKL